MPALDAHQALPDHYRHGMTSRLLPVALGAAGILLLSACSGSTGVGEATQSGSAASSSDSTSASATPATSGSAAAPAKPDLDPMAVDALADAVLGELDINAPDTFSDQLVTIAMSPLTRELAAAAGVTTALDSKGSRVVFTMTGEDVICLITVSDAPRARGVICR